MKWFICYQKVRLGSEKQHGSSSYGFTLSYETDTRNTVSDVHPFIFEKENRVTLISWQKLDAEDQLVLSKLDARSGF